MNKLKAIREKLESEGDFVTSHGDSCETNWPGTAKALTIALDALEKYEQFDVWEPHEAKKAIDEIAKTLGVSKSL